MFRESFSACLQACPLGLWDRRRGRKKLVSVPVSKHVLSDNFGGRSCRGREFQCLSPSMSSRTLEIENLPDVDLFQCLSPSMSSRTLVGCPDRHGLVSVPVSKHVLSDIDKAVSPDDKMFQCLSPSMSSRTKLKVRKKQSEWFQCLSPSMSSRTHGKMGRRSFWFQCLSPSMSSRTMFMGGTDSGFVSVPVSKHVLSDFSLELIRAQFACFSACLQACPLGP